jgi:putative heme-binding domain-containing protein
VRCQVAVAAGRLHKPDGLPILIDLLHNAENAKDPLIPTIVYNNLKPMVLQRGQEILDLLEKDDAAQKNFGETVVRWVERAVNTLARTPEQIGQGVRDAVAKAGANPRISISAVLQDAIDAFDNTGVKSADRGKYIDEPTRGEISRISTLAGNKARLPATIVALWWNDENASKTAREMVADRKLDAPNRSLLLKALSQQKSADNVSAFSAFVLDNHAPVRLRQEAVAALGAMDAATAAAVLVDDYAKAEPADLKPMIIDTLVQSKAGSFVLLSAAKEKRIPQSQITENHARRIAGYSDAALTKELSQTWGTIRTERKPERQKIAEKYKAIILAHAPGNPLIGQKVFAAKCMQCHTIYGKGGEVGPDITGVGRDNLDLILSNVLDPNLVVGKPYYQWIVKLKNGTSANGLLAEENDKQIVLKDGTQKITISRADIDRMKETTLSMMPEGLEATMTEQEFIDLVGFLLTKQPPGPWGK